jgi:hypothetical protein
LKLQAAILDTTRWMLVGSAVAYGCAAASLSGVVLGDNNAPVANARVFYQSIPPIVRGPNRRPIATAPIVGGSLQTGADGRFAVSGIPAGIYQLCAYGLTDHQLGSCDWIQGATHADLSAGQTVQNMVLRIAEGALLTFEVKDPESQIRDLADLQVPGGRMPLSGGNFAIGVFAGTRYARAKLASTTPGHRQYQLAIPKNDTVRLFLETSLSVKDAAGATVITHAPGVRISPEGQSEMTISLTVP